MSEPSKPTPFDDYATYSTIPTPLVQRNTHPKSNVLNLETLGKPIDYVRLTWVDLANTVRYRVIPWDQYLKLLSPKRLDAALASSRDPNKSGPDQSQRRGMTIGRVVFGYVAFRTAPGFGPVGDWLWVPDESSLRIVFVEGRNIASVFGWFREKSTMQSVPVPRIAAPDCPRSLLARVVRYARETAKIKFLVGVELEFILLSDTKTFTPVNKHSWCDSASLPTGSKESTVLQEIADNLQNGGIELLMYHAEGAEGQYEVITGPLTPLEAADALIYTRETIINTAVKHGLRATFSPRVFNNAPGSGQHTHLSVASTVSPHKSSIPASSSAPNLNIIEAAFLASFLAHLPAIQAFSQPFPGSYLRVQDGIWSGGTYVAWGTNNREAAVRLVDSEPGWEESRRFEIRPIDGLANPYLSLAAILAAGTSGVAHKATLAIEDLKTGSAATLSDAERSSLGIRHRLSQSWTEARSALQKDEELTEMLGKEFVKDYLNVNGTIVEWLEEDKELSRQKYVEYY